MSKSDIIKNWIEKTKTEKIYRILRLFWIPLDLEQVL
jgi:hypothetical protein